MCCSMIRRQCLVQMILHERRASSISQREYSTTMAQQNQFSSSTEIALLHQQVDSLTNYIGWVIGGVTLTITVLLALFALIQFVYQRKLQQEEIDALEKSNNENIEAKLAEIENRLKKYTSTIVQDAETKLTKVNATPKLRRSGTLRENWPLLPTIRRRPSSRKWKNLKRI